MCVVGYSPGGSDIEIYSVQEFILLKPRYKDNGILDVHLNIIMDVKKEDASLCLMQRGVVEELKDFTKDISQKDDWIYNATNKLGPNRMINADHPNPDIVEIKYNPPSKDLFSKSNFQLTQWPDITEINTIKSEITYIPFSKIIIKHLERGKKIIRINYLSDYGISYTYYQRKFLP